MIKTTLQSYFSPKILYDLIQLMLDLLNNKYQQIIVEDILKKCKIKIQKYKQIEDYINFVFISFRLWIQKHFIVIKCKNQFVKLYSKNQYDNILDQLHLQISPCYDFTSKLKYQIQPIYDQFNDKFRPLVILNYYRTQEILVQNILKTLIPVNYQSINQFIDEVKRLKEDQEEKYIVRSLDISQAYSQIKQQELIEILIKILDTFQLQTFVALYQGITYQYTKEQLINQIKNIVIQPTIGILTQKYILNDGIIQGGLLSPIFCYLYYNTKLQQLYSQQILNKFTSIVYVDDILIYGEKDSCENILEQIQDIFQCKNKRQWLKYSIPDLHKSINLDIEIDQQFNQLWKYCIQYDVQIDFIVQQLVQIVKRQTLIMKEKHDSQLYYDINKLINITLQCLLYYNKIDKEEGQKINEYIKFETCVDFKLYFEEFL